MTPKEKAMELVGKFADIQKYSSMKVVAKNCSFIVVEEVINEGIENGVDDFYNGQGYYIDNETYYVFGYTEYWQEVKKEIEAL